MVDGKCPYSTQHSRKQLLPDIPPVVAPPGAPLSAPPRLAPRFSLQADISKSSNLIPSTQVTSLKFDGAPLDRAWLSSRGRKNTGEGWTGSANGGKQISLLDAYLGADGTVSAGGIRRKVYGMAFAFQGILIRLTDSSSGYAYYPGKLALVASLAEKPVGSNGDLIRIRYFGSIDEKGKLDDRAYSVFGKDSPPDTWAFRRVHLATGAQSFCMFDEPRCPVTGRNGEKTPFFVLYTSKGGGPEGVTTSSDLVVANDTCAPAKLLERHLNDMAWWSFQ